MTNSPMPDEADFSHLELEEMEDHYRGYVIVFGDYHGEDLAMIFFRGMLIETSPTNEEAHTIIDNWVEKGVK